VSPPAAPSIEEPPHVQYDRHGILAHRVLEALLVEPIVNTATDRTRPDRIDQDRVNLDRINKDRVSKDPIDHARVRPADRALRILIATLFGLLILLAWVGLPFDMPYIGYGLASAFVFQIAVRPRRWEILGVLLGGAALTSFDQFIIHYGSRPQFQITACFGYLGLISFLVMGFRAVWAEEEERQELKSILISAAALTFFVLGSQRLLNLGGLLFPDTTDLYAYAFDGSLGFQPSFLIGRLFQDYPWIGAVGRFTYYSLPLAMALVYAAHLRRKRAAPLFILELFMAAGLIGYFLYLMFPATGPVYISAGFPRSSLSLSQLHDLALQPIPVNLTVPRNAMPSLHMAWVLLIWFNCKSFSRPVRALAFLLLLTTVFDTLGTGEHYFIDLVVAFPFAVAVQALCTNWIPIRSRNRFFPLLGGFSLTLLWPMLVRYGTRIFLLTPLIPWACIMATTALAALGMKQILSAAEIEPQSTAAIARPTAAGK
jgi:hypothetical protein